MQDVCYFTKKFIESVLEDQVSTSHFTKLHIVYLLVSNSANTSFYTVKVKHPTEVTSKTNEIFVQNPL